MTCIDFLNPVRSPAKILATLSTASMPFSGNSSLSFIRLLRAQFKISALALPKETHEESSASILCVCSFTCNQRH
jgi:hypothetical protein